jgi:hypothetical protein
VTFLADNNIWVFGDEALNANGTPIAGFQWSPGQDTVTNVIYHWDGSMWSKVANAPGVDGASSLDSMSVIAPGNLWLLGHTSKNQPLLEHWDGKAWSVIAPTSPVYGSATNLTIKGQRAWALVEEYSAHSAQNAQPFTLPDTTGMVLETNC